MYINMFVNFCNAWRRRNCTDSLVVQCDATSCGKYLILLTNKASVFKLFTVVVFTESFCCNCMISVVK